LRSPSIERATSWAAGLRQTSDDLDAKAIARLKRGSPSAAPLPDVNLDKVARPCFESWMRPMPNNHRQPVDRTKLLIKLRELEEEWRAFERRLRKEEHEIWQPDWSHGDALAERLSRVGYPQETIDVLKKHLDIINRFLCGEPLSPDILKDLDQMDATERAAGESAVKQLAAIVIATPNRVPQAKQPQSPRYGVEVSRVSNPSNFPGFIRFGG
jgi:hypothetical protein